MEWLTEDEFLAIAAGGDRQTLCDVLDRVYNRAIEQALCHIPEVVNKLSKKIQVVNKVLSQFYKDNPELLGNNDIVIREVQKVEFEHPEIAFEDVLEKALPKIKASIALIQGGPNG